MLLRLFSKVKKFKIILNFTVINADTLLEFKLYDFTIPDTNAIKEKNRLKFTKDYNNNYKDYSTNKFLSDNDTKYEYNYKIFIKLENNTTLLAKFNYYIPFKPEKTTGTGTQLVDNHNFEKFQANY
ncbi:19269_t:CDS:2 [Cetraspora pellucida]|uniref:19269_t:CDS:1 n=1 Tax=Cetraspora pellucida TaxID=1433469 RepID=A0A9N9E491_9GLOM|nr:19269_t:CDS:2 [Cetraspora pellucida]